MSRVIKITITLLSTFIFLTACSTTTSNEEPNWNSQAKQESKEQNIALEEKINNKQKYIVIHKDISDDVVLNDSKEIQKYIEENTNSMYSKNYQLIQQNITFGKLGMPRYVILTFEYKGD